MGQGYVGGMGVREEGTSWVGGYVGGTSCVGGGATQKGVGTLKGGFIGWGVVGVDGYFGAGGGGG